MKTYKINGQIIKANKISDAIKSVKDSIKDSYFYSEINVKAGRKYAGKELTGDIKIDEPLIKNDAAKWGVKVDYVKKAKNPYVNYELRYSGSRENLRKMLMKTEYLDKDEADEYIEDSIKDGGSFSIIDVDTGEKFGNFSDIKSATIKAIQYKNLGLGDHLVIVDNQSKKHFSLEKNNTLKSLDSVKDDLGTDVSEYQKWVDYDMKRYHKISGDTMYKIKKAGLDVVKDRYGDYEVIAHRRDEEKVEDDGEEDISYLSKEEEQAIDDYRKAIANTKDPLLLRVFSHILKEEIEHLEELGVAKEEVEDSVKDRIGVNAPVEKTARYLYTWIQDTYLTFENLQELNFYYVDLKKAVEQVLRTGYEIQKKSINSMPKDSVKDNRYENENLAKEINRKFVKELNTWDGRVYADTDGLDLSEISASKDTTRKIIAYVKAKGKKVSYTEDDAFLEIHDSVKKVQH